MNYKNTLYLLKHRILALLVLSIISQLIYCQITASKSAGCAPLTNTFSTASTLTSYYWDFGNGVTSTSPTPGSVTYSTSGTYTITLRNFAGGPILESYTLVVSNKPTITLAPIVGSYPNNSTLSINPVINLPSGISIQRTSITSGTGQSQTSSTNPPSAQFTYSQAGQYNIGVTVQTSPAGSGCDVSQIFNNIVTFNRFEGNIISDEEVKCIEPVRFTFGHNVTSVYPIVSYLWDFDNGQTSTSSMPSPIEYPFEKSTKNVKLIVTDSLGEKYTITKTVKIVPNNVTGIFGPDTLCLNSFSKFRRDGNEGLNIQWIAPGDNTILNAGDSISVRYNKVGNYTITLNTSLAGSPGCNKTFTKNIVVIEPKPILQISPVPACNKTFNLSLNVVNSNLYDSVEWRYRYKRRPDSLISKSFSANVLWLHDRDSIDYAADTGRILVRVYSKFGCSYDFDTTIYYYYPARITLDQAQGCVPLTVNFRDESYRFNKTNRYPDIVNWRVVFGDGASMTRTDSFKDSIPHTYTTPGTYTAYLITTNTAGCIDTSLTFVVKAGDKLTPQLTISGVGCTTSSTITLTNTTVGTYDQTKFFADGFQCSNQNSYSFQPQTMAGNDSIVMEVSDRGCKSRDTFPITIPGSIAQFEYEINCNNPTQLIMRNTSKNATNYIWEIQPRFGSWETVSTTQNPIITIRPNTRYIIRLTTTNSVDGCPPSSYMIPNVQVDSFTARIGFTSNTTKDSFVYNWPSVPVSTVPIFSIFKTLRALSPISMTNREQYPYEYSVYQPKLPEQIPAPIYSMTSNNNVISFQNVKTPLYTDIFLTVTNEQGCKFRDTGFYASDTIYHQLLGARNNICKDDTIDFTSLYNTFFEIKEFRVTIGNDVFITNPYDSIRNWIASNIYKSSTYSDTMLLDLLSLGDFHYQTYTTTSHDVTKARFLRHLDSVSFWTQWGDDSTAMYLSQIKAKLSLPTTNLWDFELRQKARAMARPMVNKFANTFSYFRYIVKNVGAVDTLRPTIRATNTKNVTTTYTQELIYRKLFPKLYTDDTLCFVAPTTVTKLDASSDTSDIKTSWHELFAPFAQYENQNNFDYTFRDSGIFNFRVTYIDTMRPNCKDTLNVKIHSLLKPIKYLTNSLDASANVCAPLQIELILRDSFYTINQNVRWKRTSGTTVINYVSSSDTLIETLAQGVHKIEAIASNNSCPDTATFDIEIYSPTARIAPSMDPICKGDSLIFTLRDTSQIGIYSVELGDGNTYNNTDSIRHVYSYIPVGNKFSVRLIYESPDRRCKLIHDTSVRIYDVKADFERNFGGDTSKCFGPYRLKDLSQNATDYFWILGDGQTSTTLRDEDVTYSQPGAYDVTLQVLNSNAGCRDTITKRIILNAAPVYQPVGDTICKGDTAVVRVINPPGFTSFTWLPSSSVIRNFGDSAYIRADSSQIITCIASSDTSNCRDTNNIDGYVMVIPPYKGIRFDTIVPIGADAQLRFSPPSSYRYTWTPDTGLSCIICDDPIVLNVESDRLYRVVFQDTIKQCFLDSSIYKIINYPYTEINLPTAFTPNGDGFNDILYARGFAIKRLKFLKIYNRWGQLLFVTEDENVGWDGTYKGELQAQDVYFYHLEAEAYLPGLVIRKQGSVMLLR